MQEERISELTWIASFQSLLRAGTCTHWASAVVEGEAADIHNTEEGAWLAGSREAKCHVVVQEFATGCIDLYFVCVITTL